MNKCPVCFYEKIYYAFKKFNYRYLQCSNCELVYSEAKLDVDSFAIECNLKKHSLLSVNDLLSYLNNVKAGDKIEITQNFQGKNILGTKSIFTFILPQGYFPEILQYYTMSHVPAV